LIKLFGIQSAEFKNCRTQQPIMAKPFLKWAGGKRQLLSEIELRLPEDFEERTTYVEPFLGGGALLFHILKNYNFENIHISDINSELILCYRQLQSSIEDVINSLENLVVNFPDDSEKRDAYYYKVRDEWNSNLDIESMSDLEKSTRVSQMIFLNKTCFNGLFRLNRSGKFNVPTGRYVKPSFPSANELRDIHIALQSVFIHNQSYENCLKLVGEDSFVYFDPPYRPLSKTSSFVSYNSGDFDDEDQSDLASFTEVLHKKNVKFLLSNSDPKNTDPNDEFFDLLYQDFNIQRVRARRAINSNPNKRGKISELLISNY